jgi:hypothetical protein
MLKTLFAILLCISPHALAGPAEDLAHAEQGYDLDGARAVVAALAGSSEPGHVELRVRAHLLVAELLRTDFEHMPEIRTKERRVLGKDIDAAADAGLGAVNALPETSEKYRLKADLVGTKIRSKYRAGKYKGEMNKSIDEALRLDPGNALAHVSKSKALILRPSPTPEELRSGLDILGTALALNDTLERARLLQAHATEQLGEHASAIQLYQRCIRENPSCLPATRALDRL